MPAATPTSPPSAPAAAAPAPPPRSGDLVDNGAMVRDGLRARSWRIRGLARSTKDVELDELELRGDLAIDGTLVADRGDVEGHLSTAGEARGSGAWRLSGESRFGGALRVGGLVAKGRVDVRGDLASSGPVRLDGSLDVLGGIEAAGFVADGSLTAVGELHSPEFTLVIRDASKVAALRCPRITVTRPTPPWASEPPVLDALEIEGKEVRLAGVTARYVKADRLAIGPGCQISEVDGSIVSQSPRSHVGPQVRSPRPKGLTR